MTTTAAVINSASEFTHGSYPWVLAAIMLWREARGCGPGEKIAIMHVVINRANDAESRWPKTIDGVITQFCQFTSMAPPPNAKPNLVSNATKWPAHTDLQFQECCEIVDRFALGIEAPDPTDGANHYYSEPLDAPPSWAIATKQTAHIGVFKFFRL